MNNINCENFNELDNNEVLIAIKQLRREVLKYYNDTTKSLLCHDKQIAELVNTIKNNLSNELRSLLDSMLESGEIESIIKQTLFANVPLSVKDFGCVGDGIHDDTPNFQEAINYALKNKVGRLIVPNGTYLITRTLEVTQEDRLFNLEIKGYGSPHIKPSLTGFHGDYLFKVTSNIEDNNQNKMKRYLTIKDIVFGSNDDFEFADCTGVYIEQQQFLNLDNVRIRGFKRSGLILNDIFDSMCHNVRILNCGDVLNEDSTKEDYALVLQGQMDNVNATKFYGLQIERCPLLMFIKKATRHNQFTDCKFEQNADNYTSKPPIYISGESGENTFTNCQFVKNSRGGNNDNQYFIESTPATSYSVSAQLSVLLNGCMFTCSSKALGTGHWINLDNATIVNNHFNQCGGNANNMYAIKLQSNNIFKGNKVYITSYNANTFNVEGNNNLIQDNFINYMAGENIDAGVFLKMNANYERNIIEGNNIKGNPKDPYSIPSDYFDKTILRNNVGYEKTIINNVIGEPILLYGSDVLVIDHSPVNTIYKFKFGYNGQRLKVYFKQAGHGINHNPDYIYMKNESGYTVKANEVIEFLNIDGVWYQI